MEEKAQDPSNKNEVVLLAQRAMRGDDSVWGEIYEKTHRYVYFMALKFLRSEQDAQDITQEVYIQAIRSIGQIYTADSFFGWLRSIIYSKCKDLVKKKKPVLLDDNDDGGSPLDDMPETGENFIPDMALDSAETRRMILELIDALPYAQRQAVMFYYYDEMTVDQIAALMECPAGTVKSRLNYARRQIKVGVEEHEKRGVKLYGVAALPILSILLRQQAQAMSIPPALSGGLAPILGQAAGSAASAAAAGTSAASAVGAATASTVKAAVPLIVKVIIGVLAAGAVIGGGVILLTNNNDDGVTQPPAITAPAATDTAPAGTDTATTAADTETQNALPSDNGGEAADSEIDTSIEVDDSESDMFVNDPYYDSLSDEQKLLLSRLEAAIQANDCITAISINDSDECHEIYNAIPGWGGLWYYPDDATSVYLYRNDNEDKSYYMTIYAGKAGSGHYCASIYFVDPRPDEIIDGGVLAEWPTYGLSETTYLNGMADGPFTLYDAGYYYPDQNLEIQTVSGNLREGIPYGPITGTRTNGDTWSDDDYNPELFIGWPDWPEGR